MLKYIGCTTHSFTLPGCATRITQTMVMLEPGSDRIHLLQQDETGSQYEDRPEPTDAAMRFLDDDARKQVVKRFWMDVCEDGVPRGTEAFFAWAIGHDLNQYLLRNSQFVRADATTPLHPSDESDVHATVDDAISRLRDTLDAWARGSVYSLTPSTGDAQDPEFLEEWELRCDADGTRFPGWSARLRVLTDGVEVFARPRQTSVTLM